MKKLIFSIFILSIFNSNLAFSDAKTGIILGSNFGMVELNNKFDSGDGLISENGNFIFGGLLGYDYKILKNISFGIESGLSYAPDITHSKIENPQGGTKIKINNINLPVLITAKYFIGNFNIFAKAGYTLVRQQFKSYDSEDLANYPSYTISQYHWNPTVSIGIGYYVTDHLAINIQYTNIIGKNINDHDNWESIQQSNLRIDYTPNTVFSNYSITAGITYRL